MADRVARFVFNFFFWFKHIYFRNVVFSLCITYFSLTISPKLSYDLLLLLLYDVVIIITIIFFKLLIPCPTFRSNNNFTNEKWPVVVGNTRENPPGTYRVVSRAYGGGNLMIHGNKLRPAATLLPRVRKRRYSFRCFAPMKMERVYTWRRRTRVH